MIQPLFSVCRSFFTDLLIDFLFVSIELLKKAEIIFHILCGTFRMLWRKKMDTTCKQKFLYRQNDRVLVMGHSNMIEPLKGVSC